MANVQPSPPPDLFSIERNEKPKYRIWIEHNDVLSNNAIEIQDRIAQLWRK